MSLLKFVRPTRGLRFRLTLIYSTIFGLFLILFAFILAGLSLDSSKKDFDSALLNYAIDLSDAMMYGPSGLSFDHAVHPGEMKKQFPFTLGKTFYSIRSMSGEIISKSRPVPEIPYNQTLAGKSGYTHRFRSFDFEDTPYRAVNIKVINGKIPLILQVASPSSILEEQQHRYLVICSALIPLLIVLASLLSYWMAGRSLEPVKQLIWAANSIAAINLSLRVPHISSGDEIEELSETLNKLLERLERAFRSQESFVANASHQLNTPLSIIKGELDVLNTKDRTPEEILKFHRSLKEELERLTDLVKRMLLISQVEAGAKGLLKRPVRMDELLLAISSRLSPKARQKNIGQRFDISPDTVEQLEVLGDRQLLDCLFENLLENAIKYSPENSTVKLLITGTKELRVEIKDEGPGIDADELKQILSQRFHRGSTSIFPGTGIGLSIAYQIAEFHHAKIEYETCGLRGSLFRVIFPK